MEKLLCTISPRESKVIKLLFGIGVEKSHSFEEVAKYLSHAKQRVTPKGAERIAITALRKLIHPARSKHLSDALGWDRERRSPEEFRVELISLIETASELTPHLISHLRYSLNDIEKLPWHVFEHLIAEFFSSWGYEDVRLVGRDPSTAADIFALGKKDQSGVNTRFFVEVKKTRRRIGIEIIDRVYGAMLREKTKYGWHLAMLVSVVGFKDVKQIKRNELSLLGVELRDREDILHWLSEYKPNDKGLWLPNPVRNLRAI